MVVVVTRRPAPKPASRPGTAFRLVRSAGAPPPPEVVVARAKPVGGAIRSAGRATLLTVRAEAGLASYVLVPERAESRALVAALASAVGARPEPVGEAPELSSASSIGWLVARPSRGFVSRDTQAGANPSEVAVLLAQVMEPGSFVALSLRPPSRVEQRRVRRFFEHRLAGVQTHYARETEAVVASIFAGAPSHEAVASLLGQLAAALPGFDLETAVGRSASTAIGPGLVGAGVVTEAVFALRLHHLLAGDVLGGVLALGGLAVSLGLVPSRARSREAAVRSGAVPAPPRRALPPRPPRRERTVQRRDQAGNLQTRTLHARDGDYPLAPTSFLLGPAMVVGLVSPHAGLSAGIAQAQVRSAPVALTGDIGPLVGWSLSGEAVHISAAEVWQSCFIVGAPGSGKTRLVQHLFAWHCLERARPSDKPDRPGRASTLVAFEHKGEEGVAGYRHWASATGDDLLVVELANPETPAIDFFNDRQMSATEKAELLVSAMRYAYDDAQIQGRSTEVLNVVFTAALACPEEVAMATRDVVDPPSFVSLAHILLGSRDDTRGLALARAMERWAAEHLDTPAGAELADAVGRLKIVYGDTVTPSQRRSLTEAARNKVDDLMRVPTWWSHSRPVLSWAQILDAHMAVVVNAGSSSDGRLVDETAGRIVSAMLAYSLEDAIKRSCAGWQDAGRSVSIFADELSQLARSSTEVVEWLRNQGRSYGVRCYLATQQPEQLEERLRSVLLGFGTVFWFQQANAMVVAQAVQQLSMTGEEWTAADLGNLEAFHAVLRARADGRLQPPVTIRIAFWGDDAARFAADQGYLLGPGGGSGAGSDKAAVATPTFDQDALDDWSTGQLDAGPPDTDTAHAGQVAGFDLDDPAPWGTGSTVPTPVAPAPGPYVAGPYVADPRLAPAVSSDPAQGPDINSPIDAPAGVPAPEEDLDEW